MAGEDKRIRDLQAQVTPLLSDFMAMDRTGAVEATRITIQQIINLAAASTPSLTAYSGLTNPDNAFGANGDLFFTIPDDNTSLSLFQKVEDAWILVFELPMGQGGGTPTSGTLEDSDSPLVITWDTDLVPDDDEGRTYLEKHGALEFVTVQVTMPDPANDGDNTPFPSWRFDEATKNILTIDNQGQKLYYTIGFGANGPASGGGGGGLELGETSTTAYRGDRGKTAYDYAIAHNLVDNTPDSGKPVSTAQQTAIDAKVANDLTASTTVAPSKTAVNTALAGKVNTDGLKVLSDENYTSAEKTKLSNLSEHYVGRYASLAALQTAHPTGLDGQYATVDTGGADAENYIWDSTDSDWVTGGAGVVASVNGQTGAVSLDTDDIGEGSTNKYWTLARTVGALLTGYVAGTTHVAVAATDTIMQAIQKVSGSITAANTDIAGKEPTITAGTSTQFWLGNKTWGTIITTVLGVVLTGLSTATSTAVIATDTILVAVGKLQGQINLLAPLISPTFTGTPAAPTAALGTKTTQIATMQAVFDAVSTLVINTQTASYTLVLTDAGKFVQMNVATANNLTVPLNSSVAFPVGTQLPIRSIGAGQTTIVATGGVTIQSAGSKLKLTGQYSGGSLIKVATDTWALMGDLSA